MGELRRASDEGLGLRGEVAAARMLLGESMRLLGRATAAAGNGDVPSVALLQLVSQQVREVSNIVSQAAAIEAKKVDQGIDAAKLMLLMVNLRNDIKRSLADAGMKAGSIVVDACFERARWTGALDETLVQEALAAPTSFDVAFRPIERDSTGKVKEHRLAFDTPEGAIAGAAHGVVEGRGTALDPTVRTARDVADDKNKAALSKELEEANRLLEQEIEEAKESGAPLPGVTESRASKLSRLDVLKQENDLLPPVQE